MTNNKLVFLSNIMNKLLIISLASLLTILTFYRFILDLNEKSDMDVLNASNQFLRMPNIKQIHISHVPDENEKLVFFLTSIAPQCIKEFSFIANKPLLQQPLISSSFYLPSLKSILSSTTQRVKLYFLRYFWFFINR